MSAPLPPRAPKPLKNLESDLQLYTIQEVCAFLNVKRRTLNRYVAEGKFPGPIRINAKMARWRATDIRAFVENPFAILG